MGHILVVTTMLVDSRAGPIAAVRNLLRFPNVEVVVPQRLAVVSLIPRLGAVAIDDFVLVEAERNPTWLWPI